MRDVFAAARGRSVLLITHRREGLDHVDEVLTLSD
jgi:ABC-type transport system involved in cytochrome bd biosynthesis fused ATPase/permease subunit